jgi:hypothetical protein
MSLVMEKWYLVKANWPIISSISSQHGIEYIGIGGDIWPCGAEIDTSSTRIYKELENSRVYLMDEMVGTIYVHTDLEKVIRYFNCQLVQNANPILIEIQHAKNSMPSKVDGYDFGNPEGGYSVIETEIILKNSADIIRRYLNVFGLFKDLSALKEFVSSLRDSEELDNYWPVSVTRISMPKDSK